MTINKTILIIGAKSDIAIAIAYKFASKGWDLQLTSRNCSELKLLVNDIKIRYKVNISVYELDILNFDSFENILNSLNYLPEIALCSVGLLGKQKDDETNMLSSLLSMKTNYLGPSLLFGEIANRFEKRGFGSIIGISSVAGERGRASNYIYGSAKSGFSTFLSGLRNRLYKSNISVLTVLPGFVKTKMIDNIDTPPFITSNPNKIAKLIFSNHSKSKVVYPYPWRVIFFIIKLIPERIFKKLNL